MFDLVADVERYPEFLPMCVGLKVLRRYATPQGKDAIEAEMQVGYLAVHEKFTSRVTLDRPNLKILVEYIDGPFRRLENIWGFREDGAGSNVDFYISYEFKSRVLALLMGTMFDAAFRMFTRAFEARADKIYVVTPLPKATS